jgi:glycosyltransferase involved in cell wall biosynthesis
VSMRAQKRRVLYGVTAPVTAQSFLRGQLSSLASHGWDVHLVCGEQGAEDFARSEDIGEAVHVVRATRDPSLRDPITLFRLFRLMQCLRPAITVMGTPKMGVLGTLAAWAARVPRRIYLVHGYRAQGLTGPKRRIMVWLERLGCAAATEVIAVSPSLRTLLIAERVVVDSKVSVLGAGSANGVDTDRFRPASAAERAQLRKDFQIPAAAAVVCSVGRLTRDKGLPDLLGVWRDVREEHADSWLLVAGAPEPVDEDDREALAALEREPHVRLLGRTANVQDVFRASDINLLLSRREGLGMVALEAAACGVPTVGLAVTGVVDAVVHGETGVLMDSQDLSAIASGVRTYLLNEDVRRSHATAARSRVDSAFRSETVHDSWCRLLSADAGAP